MNMARQALVVAALMLLLVAPADADVVVIGASKDNTLYEDAGGTLSNGAGQHLFAGRTSSLGGFTLRRGVIQFDIAAAVPAGSTINSVQLRLNVSKMPLGDIGRSFSLHSLTQDWGEGTSDAIGNEGRGTGSTLGDATWIHRFFSSLFWTTAGGDFDASASATINIAFIGPHTWGSTPAMVVDVREWMDNPASNFGWIIIGEEASNRSARRFDSRENLIAGNRPQLTIDFTPPLTTGACCDDLTGICTDDVEEADCTSGGGRFGGLGSTCATIDPPCVPKGACCDKYTAICTDGVLEANCSGIGIRYGGDGTTCATIDPPCTIVPPIFGVSRVSPRYLAITLPLGPDPVALLVTPACAAGTSQYVGAPFGSDNVALLVGNPLDAAFLTTEQWGRRVHVTGDDVGPDALYDVQVDSGTPGSPVLSPIVSGMTSIWGDVAGPFQDGVWSLPDDSVSVVDLVSINDTFTGQPTKLPIYRVDLIGAGAGGIECLPDQVVAILEVVGYLDAFQGKSFVDSTPCTEPCP